MAIGANMTKREQTLAAVAVMALLAVGAFGYFVYMPKRETLAALAAHVDSVETLNRKARVDLARGNASQLKAEAERYGQDLTLMRQLVPTSTEVPALLEDVSTAARRAGLDLATVEPIPVIEGEQFDTYRYKIGVIGSYHDIGQFLSNVGSLNRIVAPITLDLKLHTGDKGKARSKPNEALLDTNFQIQTYVARSAPPVPLDKGRK